MYVTKKYSSQYFFTLAAEFTKTILHKNFVTYNTCRQASERVCTVCTVTNRRLDRSGSLRENRQ